MSEGLRLDKWLWAARFFKTRSLAAQAIKGGHVRVDGQRVKPSKEVATGMEVAVSRPPFTRTVVITGLSHRRGSATVAAILYRETEDSIEYNEQIRQQQKLINQNMPRPVGRPSKRDRRHIIRFIRKDS